MNEFDKKRTARFTRASKWHALFTGATVAALLVAASVEAAGNPNHVEQDAASAEPTDRAAVLELIRQADARAEAESLAELRKNLTPLEREWGIKFLGLRLTAAGYALDFRYKVLDADKALPLLNRGFQLTPFVLVEKSGAKLGVPFTEKAGSLRSSVSSAKQIKVGRNYSAIFANPGNHVSSGDQVTIIIGDFRAEHVAVQ